MGCPLNQNGLPAWSLIPLTVPGYFAATEGRDLLPRKVIVWKP